MAYHHTTVVDNQIKALPTVDTASGSIATFNTDMTENLIECVCGIISGANSIRVSATGKNLFDKNSAISGMWDSGGGYALNASFRTVYCRVKPNTTYYISGVNDWDNLRLCYFNQLNPITFTNRYTYIGDRQFTTGADTILISFSPSKATYDLTNNVQVEKSTTPTAYESFGNSYTIPIGETLSDIATYNAVTGVLTRNDTTTKQLDSCPIVTLDNEVNNIFNDCGDTSVKYLLSVGKKIS